jgi:guanylate kinase
MHTPETTRTGHVFVVCGPSGVGKDTLLDRALPQTPARLLPSCVSRPQRATETEGVDAYFHTRLTMQRMIDTNDLLEWAEYAGNLYGTPRAPVDEALAGGDTVVLRVTLAGMRSIRSALPEVTTIFIAPRSLDVLKERLIARGTDTPEAITQRLHAAEQELAAIPEFDHVIVNDDLITATHQLVSLLRH